MQLKTNYPRVREMTWAEPSKMSAKFKLASNSDVDNKCHLYFNA